jgi:hypothetical protein
MKKLLLTLLLLLPFGGFSQDLASGLVACYPFTGNADDGSGNGNHGTVNGAVLTTDRFGNGNSAYGFDGANDYIAIPVDKLTNPVYTFSFWAKPASIPASPDSYAILSIGGPGADQGILLSNNYVGGSTGWAMVSYHTDGTLVPSNSVGALPDVNTWYHIVQTRSANAASLYVNGVLIGTRPTNGKTAGYKPSGPGATIGSRSNLIQFFHGEIDDLRLYNRALSAEEVQALYLAPIRRRSPCGRTTRLPVRAPRLRTPSYRPYPAPATSGS